MLIDIIGQNINMDPEAQTVVRGQENRSRRVMLIKGDLVGNSRSASRGLNARVRIGGNIGFASIASYSEQDVKKVIEMATQNAQFLSSHAGRSAVPIPSVGHGMVPLNREIVDFEQKHIIEACKEVDSYIAAHFPKLSTRRVVYTEDSQDKIIYTSDAYCGHVTTPRCYIYVFLSAETDDGTPVELFKAFGGAGSFEDQFADLSTIYPEIDALVAQLMDKREGIFPEAGEKTVVLGGMMAGMLAHEAVGHTVEADLVLGGSVAGPNLGKQVASSLISMVDFGHTGPNGQEGTVPLPVYLDDEGVPATDAVLIKDGFLVGYMNNRETAQRFGVKPSGNARAWAFGDEPLIRMRNTCILPGTSSVDDLIASVDDGYYLIASGNGQADLTGEFMFGVTLGYEIRGGKLGRALRDTTVSGVAFDMLKSVDMVSNEITWSSSGFCGKKQIIPVGMGGPHLRCKITMGGR
ncbi:MAG: TldD/PmbA family protein [Clostridia bacterium]|nr:TldD/PmbA family protein [Clostridia bacterium]